MKRTLGALALTTLAALPLARSEPGTPDAGPDLLQRRTAEYDYDVPAPGSYTLPVLQPAQDGVVLGTNGAPVRLHDLMRDRVVVLSFVYTRCSDPRACLRATGVLSQLQRITQQRPALAEKLLLITLSFDPGHDTPAVMARYGRVSLEEGAGAEWLFLTPRSLADLEPLLETYGQRVDRRKTFSATGPYYHPLRVYLIDPAQQVRNIYSYGLLDPRLVATDAQTLLLEEAEREATRGDTPGASQGQERARRLAHNPNPQPLTLSP